MKKVFLALAAVAMLAGCSKDEEINVLQPEAIGFGDAFVDNATRAIDPSYSDSKLIDGFKVWGNVTGNTNNTIELYKGVDVTRNNKNYGVAWDCTQKEYWIPSATYSFMAIANATTVATTNNMPTSVTFTNTGETDLIISKNSTTFGAKTVTTNVNATPTSGVNDNNIVDFTFGHVLSKVGFEFQNAAGNANYTYQISNIKATGAFQTGTFNISGTQGWTGQATGNLELIFGNAVAKDATAEVVAASIANSASGYSNYQRLLIPGEQTLTISYTEDLYYNGTKISSIERTGKTVTHNFAVNGNYNIVAKLTSGGEITFTVKQLTGWDSSTDITIP